MNNRVIEETVYWWFEFLAGRQPKSRSDYERLLRVFGLTEHDQSASEDWQSVQSISRKIWQYLECVENNRRRSIFVHFAKNFCHHEGCPVVEVLEHRRVKATEESGAENVFFNFIVGPEGNLKKGSPNDFAKAILKRLAITGHVSEAYYHDTFAVKSLLKDHSKEFATAFLEALFDKISCLMVVTSEDVDKVNAKSKIPFKQIPEKSIHDRFLILCEDGQWKGVMIGTSINSFPSNTCPDKPHFLIGQLDAEDVPVLAEVIRTKIARM